MHDISSKQAEEPSIGTLASSITADAVELVRGEVRLAIGELQAKGSRVGPGLGMIGAAGVVALYGVGTLVVAALAALALVVSVWAAALIVTGCLLALALVLGLAGKSRTVQALPPAPERAIAGAREDIARVKESLHR